MCAVVVVCRWGAPARPVGAKARVPAARPLPPMGAVCGVRAKARPRPRPGVRGRGSPGAGSLTTWEC
jgi:hypothetical protein